MSYRRQREQEPNHPGREKVGVDFYNIPRRNGSGFERVKIIKGDPFPGPKPVDIKSILTEIKRPGRMKPWHR